MFGPPRVSRGNSVFPRRKRVTPVSLFNLYRCRRLSWRKSPWVMILFTHAPNLIGAGRKEARIFYMGLDRYSPFVFEHRRKRAGTARCLLAAALRPAHGASTRVCLDATADEPRREHCGWLRWIHGPVLRGRFGRAWIRCVPCTPFATACADQRRRRPFMAHAQGTDRIHGRRPQLLLGESNGGTPSAIRVQSDETVTISQEIG